MNLLSGRVGSRWRMAIEWDVPADIQFHWIDPSDVEEARLQELLHTSWCSRLGSFWVWADGCLVGNSSEIELLGVGMGLFQQIASETGERASDLLSSMAPKDALEMVMDSIYAENGESIVAEVGNLCHHEVMPSGCPYFDGWQAILVERGDSEVFIWRHGPSGPVETATWPLGEVRRVVERAMELLGQ